MLPCNCFVVIPAIKKNTAFTNDLVKKLAGISLLDRVIAKAKLLALPEDILILTDSEEISVICRRSGVRWYFDRLLRFSSRNCYEETVLLLQKFINDYQYFLFLSAYSPLLGHNEIEGAFNNYLNSNRDILVATYKETNRAVYVRNQIKIDVAPNDTTELLIESRAFQIKKSILLDSDWIKHDKSIYYHILINRDTEIDSYHDWWGCERLLGRKRIVFTTIGNQSVGMGHVYRTLSLARELTDHEILIIGDDRNSQSTNDMIGYEHIYSVHNKTKFTEEIVALSPHLVINDILDTDASYIQSLRDNNIHVLNFEDLGTGAAFTDKTINELYDIPLIQGENIVWGHDYLFLRDEFYGAKPIHFTQEVKTLLLTFGAADPNDFTRKILRLIYPFCNDRGIKIIVVIGAEYGFTKELYDEIESCFLNIECFNETASMSALMEQCQLSICSNGRTLYELAHMHIPAIVLSHHLRESLHSFANTAEGFINIGIHNGSETNKTIISSLKKLVMDTDLRGSFHQNLKRYNFLQNKSKIVNIIKGILEE